MEEENLKKYIILQMKSQTDAKKLPVNKHIDNKRKYQISGCTHYTCASSYFFYIIEKKQLPTLYMIKAYLKQPEIYPALAFSKSSVHRFMLQSGFEFTSVDNYYTNTKSETTS